MQLVYEQYGQKNEEYALKNIFTQVFEHKIGSVARTANKAAGKA